MIFRVIIVNFDFVSHAWQSSMSAPGWFKQRRPLIGKNTEAAPNSYTGSGHCLFPDSDGIASTPLFRGELETLRPRNLSVPRAGQAKRRARSPKSGVLFAGSIRRGIETAANSSSASSDASAQFKTGSARGQPRLAPRVRNPRSPARRPIQAGEVESFGRRDLTAPSPPESKKSCRKM